MLLSIKIITCLSRILTKGDQVEFQGSWVSELSGHSPEEHCK